MSHFSERRWRQSFRAGAKIAVQSTPDGVHAFVHIDRKTITRR